MDGNIEILIFFQLKTRNQITLILLPKYKISSQKKLLNQNWRYIIQRPFEILMNNSNLTRLRKQYSYRVVDLIEQIKKLEKDDLINIIKGVLLTFTKEYSQKNIKIYSVCLTFNDQMIIEIVKLNPPQKRKISEIVCLIQATKEIPFFKKLIEERGIESQKQFCKQVIYGFYQTNEVVFNQGDVADRFYVVLKGKVGIIVNHTENVLNSKGEMQKNIVSEEVNTIGSGFSIGEIAILKDQKRNAGIVCKEDTHFLILEKEDFNKIIGKLYNILSIRLHFFIYLIG